MMEDNLSNIYKIIFSDNQEVNKIYQTKYTQAIEVIPIDPIKIKRLNILGN